MLKSEMIAVQELHWKKEDEGWWSAEVKMLGLYYEVRQSRDGHTKFRTSLDPNRWRDHAGDVRACMQAMQDDFEGRINSAVTEVKLPGLAQALDPFVKYSKLEGFQRLPDNFPITPGSPMAAQQLTKGHLIALLDLLSGFMDQGEDLSLGAAPNVQRHPNAYEVIREVTSEECYWLEESVKAGQRVYEYIGVTYGVISERGIAVTLKPFETPFFELPRSALKRINE